MKLSLLHKAFLPEVHSWQVVSVEMLIAVQIDIEAPLDSVWSLLNDESRHAFWMPGIIQISYPDVYDRKNPIGTHFRQLKGVGRRRKICLGEVTAYKAPSLLGFRLGDGLSHIDTHYRLRPMGTGTRLDCEVDITAGTAIGRAFGFVMRIVTARILGRHLDELKRLTEDAVAGLNEPV